MAYGQSQPSNGAGSTSQSQGGAKQQATHDLVQCDADGEIIKAFDESIGKEVSVRIASMWLKEKSGFIKFEDGLVCKVFPRKPKDGGGKPGAPTAQQSSPAQGVAKGGGAGGSRFSAKPK